MALNPQDPTGNQLRVRQEALASCFNSGSPYFDMYKCGYYGVELDDCIAKCKANGIAIRNKDIENWKNGRYNHDMIIVGSSDVVTKVNNNVTEAGIPIDESKLSDLPLIPRNLLEGNRKRFFPCTADNRPMQKWGYTHDFNPKLYSQSDAKALSPVGWIGQNMFMQPFVVVDIDGRGHGEEDWETIKFGRFFENVTMKMEDPEKPGSFHLYFKTDRLIPVRHWPHAKIDFMGNATNAAVYLKNKKSNGLEPTMLTENFWMLIQEYQKIRKERINGS